MRRKCVIFSNEVRKKFRIFFANFEIFIFPKIEKLASASFDILVGKVRVTD